MRQGGLSLCVLAGDSQSIPYRDNNLVPFGIVAVSTLRGCLVSKSPEWERVAMFSGGNPVAIALSGRSKPLICRVSSAVEQRFCKPLVGSSILSPGTVRSGASCKVIFPAAREGRSPLPGRDCGTAAASGSKRKPRRVNAGAQRDYGCRRGRRGAHDQVSVAE